MTPPQSTESRAAPADALPDGPGIPIADAAELLGLSPHTLRYYERDGLVAVDRDAHEHRSYTPRAVGRLEFLRRMRCSGMTIGDLHGYLALVARGPATEPERLALMLTHRESIRGRMAELQRALEATEYKIATYGGALDGACPPRPTPDDAHRTHSQEATP